MMGQSAEIGEKTGCVWPGGEISNSMPRVATQIKLSAKIWLHLPLYLNNMIPGKKPSGSPQYASG